MSSAAAQRGRKRLHDGAREGASPARHRRRLLSASPSPFRAVRSFGPRVALSSAPHSHRKRRHDGNTTSAGTGRRRLAPSQFSPVRPFSLRAALATSPHRRRRRRKRRINDAGRPTSAGRRRSSRSSVHSKLRHFVGLRPFSLRFLLGTGASALRRRRKLTALDMGNFVSQLFGKSTSDGGLEVHRKRIEGSPELVDLTVDAEVEPVDVVRRGIGDWRAPASEPSTPLKKRATFYREALHWTKRHEDGRLQESEFEVKLREIKLAELPGVLDHRSKEDLSEVFTPLTDKEEREINTLLCDSGHSGKILVTHEPSNIEITQEKLQCLSPHGWLNDEVINLYIELLKERAEREPQRFLKCHFFNTFFYSKLTCGINGYDYQSVRRWTTFKKLGYGLIECEKIFVPVHRGTHWCLAIINVKDKTFQYLDSLGGLGQDVLRILARYIVDELKGKSNIEIDISSWVVGISDSLPLQHNGWDCGMFMLKFIDFHSRGLKPFFNQGHMMYFRKRTAKEIMRLRAD